MALACAQACSLRRNWACEACKKQVHGNKCIFVYHTWALSPQGVVNKYTYIHALVSCNSLITANWVCEACNKRVHGNTCILFTTPWDNAAHAW
jgi:hypothetical protein